MAMFGPDYFLCEACKHFNSDGIDGNHPYCSKKLFAPSFHAVRIGDKCPYFKPGVPCGYQVSMERNRKKAHEIFEMLGIEVDE